MMIPRLFELLATIGIGYIANDLLDGKSVEHLTNIATTFAAVSATLMGFLIAALSILTALTDRQLVQNMKKTGHYDELLRLIYWTTAILLAVLTLSLVALFIDGKLLISLVVISAALMGLSTWMLVKSGHRLSMVLSLVK
ncbi:MAG: hypothetical protein AB2603_12030 [Candidatus Thiodiazotropha endolucinida]